MRVYRCRPLLLPVGAAYWKVRSLLSGSALVPGTTVRRGTVELGRYPVAIPLYPIVAAGAAGAVGLACLQRANNSLL